VVLLDGRPAVVADILQRSRERGEVHDALAERTEDALEHRGVEVVRPERRYQDLCRCMSFSLHVLIES
jgi:hypothetical protein